MRLCVYMYINIYLIFRQLRVESLNGGYLSWKYHEVPIELEGSQREEIYLMWHTYICMCSQNVHAIISFLLVW